MTDAVNASEPARLTPETFTDVVDLVVPELQARGVYKRDYAPGTLREKLYGPGRARLPQTHPAARVRPRVGQPEGSEVGSVRLEET